MQRANGLIPLSLGSPLPWQLKLCSYCCGLQERPAYQFRFKSEGIQEFEYNI
jgi:hypothetical protein